MHFFDESGKSVAEFFRKHTLNLIKLNQLTFNISAWEIEDTIS
jgi:hypothetical protein